jgi:hypothetical protein
MYLCLAATILGLLIYGFATNAKASEVGRILYMVALFVFLFKIVGTETVNLFK